MSKLAGNYPDCCPACATESMSLNAVVRPWFGLSPRYSRWRKKVRLTCQVCGFRCWIAPFKPEAVA